MLNIEVQPVIKKFSLRDLLKKALSFSKIFYLYMLLRLQQGFADMVTSNKIISSFQSHSNISLMRHF